MKNIKLCTVFDVPIVLHHTYLLFMLGIFGTSIFTNKMESAILLIGWIMIAHFFVTIHEYGHILMGRKMGYTCEQTLLTPIGGVAIFDSKMESISPKQEIMLAIAGPMTNFIWVGIFYLIACILNVPYIISISSFSNILSTLGSLNLFIGCFNLCPAFPMDGGRICRSVLSHYMSKYHATKICLYVGLAVFILLFAIFRDFILLIILLFVFMATKEELKRLR